MSERKAALAAELTVSLRAALEATSIEVGEAGLEEDPESGVQAGEVAYARTPAESNDPLPGIELIAPADDALKLSLLRLGIDKEELEEKISEGFGDDSLESLRAFLEDLWGGLRVRFEEVLERPLTSGAFAITAPSTTPPELQDRDVRLVIAFKLDGVLDSSLEVRVAGAALEPIPVILVESEVENLTEIIAELGQRAVLVSPAELRMESARGWCGSPGIVLSWNLGDVLAPDWIRTLRENSRTQALKLIVSMSSPTRAGALAALRSGADSVLASPYTGTELAKALGIEASVDPPSESNAVSESSAETE